MTKKNVVIIGLTVIILIILIDQITKWFLIEKDIILIPDILSLTYTKNFENAVFIDSANVILLVIVDLTILGIIIKLISEKKNEMNFKTLVLLFIILSGVLSNLLDRIFRGYVIDFIAINSFNFNKFNIADICIVSGIILIFIFNLKKLIKK